MTFTVLHVCTGNICRSPMAERIMRSAVHRRFGEQAAEFEIRGAGTYGGHAGQPMHPPAAQVLAELGCDAGGFAATWLQERQVQWAELILTATADHRRQVLGLDPRALRRTFTLVELARLVAPVQPDALPPGSPAERLGALVGLAVERRAIDPPPHRGADDIDDPFEQHLDVYRGTAREISAAIETILRPL